MPGNLLRRADVSAVAMDPNHKVPVVLLKPEDDDRFIPIWIGMAEASAILVALEGVEPARPMTHDLMHDVMRRCDVLVTRVEVVDLKDGTYFAEICVAHAGREMRVDSRPSDALAIALRAEAPIYIHERVLERVQFVDDPGQGGEEEVEAAEAEDLQPAAAVAEEVPRDEDEMRRMLEDLDPDDFKYRQ